MEQFLAAGVSLLVELGGNVAEAGTKVVRKYYRY